MKYLINSLFLLSSLSYFQCQAMEADDGYDEPEYTSHRLTVEELVKTVGEKNMEEVISWAPQLDFMKSNKVLMYGIGYDRISGRIAALRLENKNQEADALEKLIHPHKDQEVDKLGQSVTSIQIKG